MSTCSNCHNVSAISHHRRLYHIIGTLQSFQDPGHVELRCLLDDPTGQHALGKYADDLGVDDGIQHSRCDN